MTPEDEARIREIVREEIKASKRKPAAPRRENTITLNVFYRWDNITQQDLDIWARAYPGIHLPTELNKAAAWVKADPSRKKSNWERFINGWLSKAQQRSQGVGMPAAKTGPTKDQLCSVAGCDEEFKGYYLGAVKCCDRHLGQFMARQPDGMTFETRTRHPDYELLRAAAARSEIRRVA